MIYTIDEIKDRIRPVAEKYNLPAVYLFGSYARGEADELSDVDIMIDRTGTKIRGLFQYAGVRGEFKDRLKKEIDLITTKGLDESNDKKFKYYVDSEKVIIYEKK
jgi:predicted nucleotidyltransferase